MLHPNGCSVHRCQLAINRHFTQNPHDAPNRPAFSEAPTSVEIPVSAFKRPLAPTLHLSVLQPSTEWSQSLEPTSVHSFRLIAIVGFVQFHRAGIFATPVCHNVFQFSEPVPSPPSPVPSTVHVQIPQRHPGFETLIFLLATSYRYSGVAKPNRHPEIDIPHRWSAIVSMISPTDPVSIPRQHRISVCAYRSTSRSMQVYRSSHHSGPCPDKRRMPTLDFRHIAAVRFLANRYLDRWSRLGRKSLLVFPSWSLIPSASVWPIVPWQHSGQSASVVWLKLFSSAPSLICDPWRRSILTTSGRSSFAIVYAAVEHVNAVIKHCSPESTKTKGNDKLTVDVSVQGHYLNRRGGV